MAVGEAKETRSPARKAEIRNRIAFAGSALLLVAGFVVFIQSRTDEGSAPTVAPKVPKNTIDRGPELKTGKNLKLDPAARRVAGRFLLTGVDLQSRMTGKGLEEAWRLAAPELRSGFTKREWLAGTLPFAPFPIRTSGVEVVATSPTEILLQAFLIPRSADPDSVPVRYDMTLVKRKGRWLVSYVVPYAPPPVRKEQND